MRAFDRFAEHQRRLSDAREAADAAPEPGTIEWYQVHLEAMEERAGEAEARLTEARRQIQDQRRLLAERETEIHRLRQEGPS